MGKVIMSGIVPQLEAPVSLPPKGTALNNCTWEQIRLISDSGLASQYFSVGDRKEIVLNGKVGQLSLSNYSTYAYIIGIDHNASVEGTSRIHFQIAQTALSGGKDIAFCDSFYENTVPSTGYFSMNSSNTNAGGWESSQMRTNICESMLNAISSDLRSVIKTVTKYTNNEGKNTSASAVTATTDYFFLLSDYEVFGTTSKSNTNEASRQEQYAYYAAGNSKIKYNHSATATPVQWSLRSAHPSYNFMFAVVANDGTASTCSAYLAEGFAPAFCV